MRHLKNLVCLIFIGVLWIPFVCSGQLTTFVIFRHAETVEADKDDPELSEPGEERARRLAEHFKTADISAIYTTSTKRTRSTVEPIAASMGLEINSYDPFNVGVTDEILKKQQGGIILIAAHSNTAPSFVNYLIGQEKYEQLNEEGYDNMFIVTVSEIGDGRVLHLSY